MAPATSAGSTVAPKDHGRPHDYGPLTARGLVPELALIAIGAVRWLLYPPGTAADG